MGKKFLITKKEKKSFRGRGRNFQVTLNQIEKYEEVKAYLCHFKSFIYGIATKEKAPKTNKEHIHYYTQYANPIYLKSDYMCGAHIEIARGSAKQNIDYIKKVNKPEERGEIIWEEGEPKLWGGLRVCDAKKLEEKDIDELPVQMLKYVLLARDRNKNILNINETTKNVKVYYFWGDTGVLKSEYAYRYIKEVAGGLYEELSYENNFWNGAGGLVQTAIYDDFRDSDMRPSEFIKFIDYRVHNLNIKNGHVQNKYTTILITSEQDPAEIYSNARTREMRGQWLRRMIIKHFWYDENKKKYFNQEENYKYDFDNRPEAISEELPIINKHQDGSLV